MADLFLSLGSNLGIREANLRLAVKLLNESNIRIKESSSIYETSPVGVVDQPLFLNLVCRAVTDLEPFEVLNTIKEIETAMGRETYLVLAPRLIDVDILLYDEISIDTPELTIPHPRMFERLFVITPMEEIAQNILFSRFPDYKNVILSMQDVQIWKGI
tara:strand:- start:32735 stop:33211 length:477 start_codon:yes stop_codon:yes gene_type:complete